VVVEVVGRADEVKTFYRRERPFNGTHTSPRPSPLPLGGERVITPHGRFTVEFVLKNLREVTLSRRIT
jgi:hypothetical protein